MLRLLLFSLLLAGCASAVDRSPSLLPRAIEQRGFAEPVRPAPVSAPDATLDGETARRGSVFDSAIAGFAQAATASEARITRGRGAKSGSDAWADAQSAVGELGQAFSQADAAMADLEQLAITRASDGKPPYPTLDARIAAAQSALDRAGARLAALKALVGG